MRLWRKRTPPVVPEPEPTMSDALRFLQGVVRSTVVVESVDRGRWPSGDSVTLSVKGAEGTIMLIKGDKLTITPFQVTS